MQQPILSICIPTYRRSEVLRKTLHSIYNQDVDQSLFEVCISDDSPDDETKNMIEKEFSLFKNLSYRKIPECGFLNIFEALRLGKGEMLKPLNDYAMLRNNSLRDIIALIEDNRREKALIYFGLSALKKHDMIVELGTYNDFIKYIDYQCTYCSSVSIWKCDFDRILEDDFEPNRAFPHTTLLFRQTYKDKFIVDNSDYVINQTLSKKGGYNLPEYFVKEYLTMAEQYLLKPGYIAKSTYRQLESSALKFTAEWYWVVRFSKVFKFSFEKHEEIIKSKCGSSGLIKYNAYLIEKFIEKIIKISVRKILK